LERSTPAKVREAPDQWFTPPRGFEQEALPQRFSEMTTVAMGEDATRNAVLAAAKGFERASWKIKENISARFKGRPGEDAYGFLQRLKKESQRAVSQGYFGDLNELIPRFGPLFKDGAKKWWGSLESTSISWDDFEKQLLDQYDERIPPVFRTQEVTHMRKSKKESSRDFAIRLREANARLGDAALPAEQLKYTFLVGHPSRQQEKIEDLRVKGRNWYDDTVSFEEFTEETYMKLDKKKRRQRRRVYRSESSSDSDSESSSSESSSSSSPSSSSSDRRKRSSRKKKRDRRRNRDAFYPRRIPSPKPALKPVVQPDPENLKKTDEITEKLKALTDEIVKCKDEIRLGGNRRGRGQSVHLTELDDEELEEEIARRNELFQVNQRANRFSFQRPGQRPQYSNNAQYANRNDNARTDKSSHQQPPTPQNATEELLKNLLEVSKNLAISSKVHGCWDCGDPSHYRGDAACTGRRNDNDNEDAQGRQKHFHSRS
jgi:hypothetical protein